MYCKKFPFFDEDNYEDTGSSSSLNQTDSDINNIQPNQMFSIDNLVFILGKFKKKQTNGGWITENLILKIFKNKVIDKYKPFNKLIHFFQYLNVDNKHFFVCCGMDFFVPTSSVVDSNFMFMTSIKIYSAEKFIDKNHKVSNSDINCEPYLLREINLLRYINDITKFYVGKDIPKGVETIQNIISFGVENELKYIAFGMDHGIIALVRAEPFIYNSNDKNTKIQILQDIETDLHVTNLCFSKYKNEYNILYASTTKQIFYYKIFDKDPKSKLYVLNEDSGAYSNCIDTGNDDNLIVATSTDNQIIEYQKQEMGPSFFFEGKKQYCLNYKNYIIFVIIDEKTSTLAVFDKLNRFFSYYNTSFTKICSICCDNENIYAFVEINNTQKKIIKLKEKDNKYKFEIFYRRSFFDTALEYAKNLNYDMKKIAEIHQRHGDHIYMKSDYQKAIEQYIYTINYLDPSYVIQKFLDGSKLDYLILYLEALHSENNFEFRCLKEMKDYTALLLNCYIKQKQIVKLKEFVEGKELTPQLLNVETAIEVCKDTNQIELALSISEKSKMFDSYVQLMIDYKSKFLILKTIQWQLSILNEKEI